MKTSLLSLLLAISLFCSAHEGGNFVSSDMLASMKPGEKAALLMVHFGTTHDDTRTQTIDAINAQARKAFPDLEFREAYTSRIVIRRLKTRGVVKNTPLDALLQLRGEGYTHIIVQSTNIIDGVEMTYIFICLSLAFGCVSTAQLSTSSIYIRASFPSYSNINSVFFKFIFKFQGIFAVWLFKIALFDRIHRDQVQMAVSSF